jgi:TRAP-type C4-dicarboxylate transport system substrate-binding protein
MRILQHLTTLAASALCFGFTSAASMAETITLKVADSYPTTHMYVVHGIKPWMARITELTQGKVKFQYFPGEQLGKFTDLPELVRTGVADIGLTPVGHLPGDYPLNAIAAMPGTAGTALEVTQAYWKLVSAEGPLRKEFQAKGLRPVAYFGLPQYEIISRSKQISTLATMKGLKIRAGGGLQQMLIEALGASAIQLPTPELYNSLERGTVDGIMVPYASMAAYKLNEVAKFATRGASLGSTIAGFAISETNWQKLPADVQAAITKASLEFMERISIYQDEHNEDAREKMEKTGLKSLEISAAEQEKIQEALKPAIDKWANDLEARGVPAKQVVAEWVAATAKK